MNIGYRTVGDVIIVDMQGRLDSQGSGLAYDELVKTAKSDNKKVVLNLANLEYASSAGLRAILTAAKLLKTSSGEMRICNAKGVVKEVLEASGFDHLVNIDDDEGAAVTALA